MDALAVSWGHAGPAVLAAFLASMVEFVEALTVILAVGSVRGWRDAVAGSAAAVAILFVLVVVFGAALTRVPLNVIQVTVGTLLLLFGLRWIRKAILRTAGVIPLHDEAESFAKHAEIMRRHRPMLGWDGIAFGACFQITMLEGTEVIFIVIAVGAGGSGLLIPAGIGALAALVLVVLLGLALHRPLAKVPENMLKFVVGALLSAFGTFWVGEGLKFGWPGGDLSLLGLIIIFLIVALSTVPLCRRQARQTRSISA